MKFEKLPLLAVLLFLPFFISCSNYPEIKWNYSTGEVTGSQPQKSDNISLDVYLDATTSMQGFAVNNTSVYSQFLDQVEAVSVSAWPNTNLRYYKFGEKIKQVDRSEFLSAKNNLPFYHEEGIFKRTYIDSVVTHTDTSRLSVLVTDLFQDAGDVNTMVESFKTKCFARGVSIGIVGIQSAFKGKVFDVKAYPQGYNLDADSRPFYAVVFGNEYNMQLLFDALKTKPFVSENNMFIISNHIINSYQVDTLVKTRESNGLNNKAVHADINSFDFSMKKEKNLTTKFNLSISLKRNPRCADFVVNNLDLVTYKKSASDPKAVVKDSVASNDFTIENIQRNGDKIKAVLALHNEEAPGNYSYEILLKAKPLNGLITPKWISDFSTDNPVPGTPTAAKTYNLENLCSTLLVANASISPVYIAKFYINIYKR